MTLFCFPENRKSVFLKVPLYLTSRKIHTFIIVRKKGSRVRCGDGSTALSKCLFRPLGHQQPQFPFFLTYCFDRCRHVRAQLSMNLTPHTERVCHFPPTTFQDYREKQYFDHYFFFFEYLNAKICSFFPSGISFICSFLRLQYKKQGKMKKAKVPKCAAAWCKKDRTSL